MKTINKIVVLAAAAAMITLGTGCQKEPMEQLPGAETSGNTIDRNDRILQGSMAVNLIGSNPGRYGALNMDLVSFSVKVIDPRTGEASWTHSPLRLANYNVIQHTAANPIAIGGVALPPGIATEIRLNLGRTSTLVWGDMDGRHAVTLNILNRAPIATSNIIVHRGRRISVTLDMDVLQSLGRRKDMYTFNPVITVKKPDFEDPAIENDPK